MLYMAITSPKASSFLQFQSQFNKPTSPFSPNRFIRIKSSSFPTMAATLSSTLSISETFSKLKKEGKVALIPYITAGDPDLSTTAEALKVLDSCGSDIIELGVPYSDPLADGPVIQGPAHPFLKPNSLFQSPLKKTGPSSLNPFPVSCFLAKESMTQTRSVQAHVCRFGKSGGNYVPETLMYALTELESAFKALSTDHQFQKELDGILKDYVGRETPLYFAERLTAHYKRPNGEGPEIYLKREDLNHTGTHQIINTVQQAFLAKKLGKERIIAAETGAAQHGVATATACARFGLQCVIYMGAQDMERQALNVFRMKLLGAEVRAVNSGTATRKDAPFEAILDWITNVETTHYMSGSVEDPHPYPMMVGEFNAVIGKEIRKQALEKWGGKPDVLVASVGGGSNAMGLFREFVDDKEVRLIGVEAAASGLDSGKHATTLTKGVLHAAMSYLLQDDDGQIDIRSISAGLYYPRVDPDYSFLKDSGRAEYYSITDEEASKVISTVWMLEDIVPTQETFHAQAYLEKLCPTLPNGTKAVFYWIGGGN